MAVAVPSDRQLIRCIRSVATRSLHRARQALARARPRIPRAPQRGGEFLLQQLFDEAANPPAYAGLEAVAPAFTNQNICCICRHWRCLLRRPLTAGFGLLSSSQRHFRFPPTLRHYLAVAAR